MHQYRTLYEMKKASSSCSVAIKCSWFYSHWKLITAALDTHIHFPLIFCMLLSSKSIPIQKHVKSKYLIYWTFLYNFLASFFTDRHPISNNSTTRIYHTTLCLTYFVFVIVLCWHTAVQLDMFFFSLQLCAVLRYWKANGLLLLHRIAGSLHTPNVVFCEL